MLLLPSKVIPPVLVPTRVPTMSCTKGASPTIEPGSQSTDVAELHVAEAHGPACIIRAVAVRS